MVSWREWTPSPASRSPWVPSSYMGSEEVFHPFMELATHQLVPARVRAKGGEAGAEDGMLWASEAAGLSKSDRARSMASGKRIVFMSPFLYLLVSSDNYS